jgi:hypothetical protein
VRRESPRELLGEFSISECSSGKMNLYLPDFLEKALEFGFEYEKRKLNDPVELFYLDRFFKKGPLKVEYIEKKIIKK